MNSNDLTDGNTYEISAYDNRALHYRRNIGLEYLRDASVGGLEVDNYACSSVSCGCVEIHKRTHVNAGTKQMSDTPMTDKPMTLIEQIEAEIERAHTLDYGAGLEHALLIVRQHFAGAEVVERVANDHELMRQIQLFHYDIEKFSPTEMAKAAIAAIMGASGLSDSGDTSPGHATRKDAYQEAPASDTIIHEAKEGARCPSVFASEITLPFGEICTLLSRITVIEEVSDARELAQQAYDKMKYLRTPKPVVISLGKCSNAFREIRGHTPFKDEMKAILDSLKAQGVNISYDD